MFLVSALLALLPNPKPPIAPPPHAAHGWALRHTLIHKAPVTAVTATGKGYASGDKDGVLLLWDAETGQLRETLLDGTANSGRPIHFVRSTPDGKRLNVATAVGSGQIAMTGTAHTYYGPSIMYSTLAICENGRWLVRSSRANFGDTKQLMLAVKYFDENGLGASWDHSFSHPTDPLLAAHAPGLVVSADAAFTVRGWKLRDDATEDRPSWSIGLAKLKPRAMAVSPDGTLVGVAGESGTVAVLSSRRGESVAALTGHTGAVRTVAFAPDSGLIATGGDDGTVRLWNPWTGEQEHLLKGHTGPITAVWFAADDVLMSAGDDKTARVWVCKP